MDLSFTACEMELAVLVPLEGLWGCLCPLGCGSWLGMWSVVSEAKDHRLPHPGAGPAVTAN